MSWLDEEMKANAERNSQPPTVPDGSNQSYFYYDTESKRYVMVGNDPDVRAAMARAQSENPDPTKNERGEKYKKEREEYGHWNTWHNYAPFGTTSDAWKRFWNEAVSKGLSDEVQGDEHGIKQGLYGKSGYLIVEKDNLDLLTMTDTKSYNLLLGPCNSGTHTNRLYGCPKEPLPLPPPSNRGNDDSGGPSASTIATVAVVGGGVLVGALLFRGFGK